VLAKAQPRLAESKLLDDDMREVRDAAVTLLVLKADVAALERVDNHRKNQSCQILRGASYSAIDLRLRALEETGDKKDIERLKRWSQHASDKAVRERIEWTISAIHDRLEYGKDHG